MTEDIQTQKEQNTVATVGMWFSIIGLILLITIFFGRLGLVLLFIGFILGIIGLFYKPKGKARVAICIPLVVFIALASITCYIWKSVKTPANEFIEWAKPQLEQLESENFDGDRFQQILQSEINSITNDKSDEDRKNLFEASTGSNFLEKGSYLLFSLLQQSMETALEKYHNGEIPELEEDGNITDVDTEIEENDEETEDESNEDESNEDESNEEITIEQPKKTSNETFSQSEKNEIEQILNIIE